LLRTQGFEPIALAAKDGLALINGTQLMAALWRGTFWKSVNALSHCSNRGRRDVPGSTARQHPAVRCARILGRPHPGHGVVAANVRNLLGGSERFSESHRNCGKVQDPYVYAACRKSTARVATHLAIAPGVFETEVNGVTLTTTACLRRCDIISCGNFHGQPLALALDFAAIALANSASISSAAFTCFSKDDGLPKLLMRETGLNSGFMIPQYTAAALVSENKISVATRRASIPFRRAWARKTTSAWAASPA